MNTISLPGAPAWFDALLVLSAQATLLAGTVWAILKLLGRWIPPSWRALLWFFVIARVLIPIAPPSAFSLQNIFVKANVAGPSLALSPRVEFPDDSREIDLQTSRYVNSTVFPSTSAFAKKPTHTEISPAKALAFIWGVGAILFLTLLIARSLIIRKRLVRHTFASDSKIVAMINECRAQLRLRFPIRIVVSDRIAAPALTGFIPARLILPTHFASGQFTPDQIRQILLHEFAHIRQGHLFLHWLTLIARCIQWFNPVIHLAASRLRHECELAADAAVLKNSTPEERAAYGETILQVLAQSTSPSTVLALGMADQARHLKERLSALSNPNRRSYSAIGVLLCAAVAIIGLSGAEEAKTDSSTRETATKIRYYMRIAECSPEMVPRILEGIGAASTLTNQSRGIVNFVLTPEQTKKLELIKQMEGVDFLEAPQRDLEIGASGEIQVENTLILKNTPAHISLGPAVKVSATKPSGDTLRLNSHLILTTFHGYSTNSEGSGQTNLLPRFRVREREATNEIAIGSSIAFYIPSTERGMSDSKKVPTLGDIPLLGRQFRSEITINTNLASLIFLTASNPNGPLPAPREPRSIQSYVAESRSLIELGKLDEAEAALRRAQKSDAEHPQILYWLEQIKKFRGAKTATSDNQKSNEDAESSSNSGKSRKVLLERLNTIQIDNFSIPQPVDLVDVLKEIGAQARQKDLQHKGINLIISQGAYRGTNTPPLDVEQFKIKIDPPLRNFNLRQLFAALVRVAESPAGHANARLNYSIEDYAVVFRAEGEDPDDSSSRKTNSSTNSVAQPKSEVGATPEIPPSALARQKLNQKLDSIRIDDFPLTTPVDLIEVVKELSFETRKLDPDRRGINFVLDKAQGRAANLNIDLDRFKIKIDPPIRDVTVHQLCDVIVRVATPPGGAPDSTTLAYSVEDYGVVFGVKVRDLTALVTRSFRVNPNDFREAMGALSPNKRGESRSDAQQQLRTFLMSVGVNFPTNNATVGGAVPQGFGLDSQQQVKSAFFNDLNGVLFVRATLEDLTAIEHALHRINMAKPEVCISVEIYELPKDQAAQIQTEFKRASGLAATNEFLFVTKDETNQTTPMLAASKALSDKLKQPVVATNISYPASQLILASEMATQLRKRLQSAKDVNSLTMPNVTTLIGRQARVSLEETSTIITGKSTNYIGAIEPLGWSVDCIPQSFDGRELQISSFATHSEFLGYEKQGEVPLPRFRIRQTGSPVKLPPGDSQALLLPLRNIKRVPILGDIPNLGRLFQNAEDTKYALVLVTPYIIDPAGNRLFPKPE